MYAKPTSAAMVEAQANIPTPSIHILRRALFVIATPKITPPGPWRILHS